MVCDQVRLSQILFNLLGNAIKFTPAGSVTLQIDVAAQTAETAALHVRFIDIGIGLPADKLQMIFEEFTQVQSTANRRFKGTGLGLSITRRLLDLLGSRMEVRSQEGSGSTFSFVLSVPIDDTQHPAPPDTSLADI